MRIAESNTGERVVPARRTILEFLGGYWDGKILDTASADLLELHQAELVLRATEGGRLGRGYRAYSTLALNYLRRYGHHRFAAMCFSNEHIYQVKHRILIGNDLWIRLEYAAARTD